MNPSTKAGPQRFGLWLRLARGGWLPFALASIGFWLVGSYLLLFGPLPDCAAAIWRRKPGCLSASGTVSSTPGTGQTG